MAARTRLRICSSSSRWSTGRDSSVKLAASDPSRLAANTMASPATALEMSMTSSSMDPPRLPAPCSRSARFPRYAAAWSPSAAVRASLPRKMPIFRSPSKMAPLMR